MKSVRDKHRNAEWKDKAIKIKIKETERKKRGGWGCVHPYPFYHARIKISQSENVYLVLKKCMWGIEHLIHNKLNHTGHNSLLHLSLKEPQASLLFVGGNLILWNIMTILKPNTPWKEIVIFCNSPNYISMENKMSLLCKVQS